MDKDSPLAPKDEDRPLRSFERLQRIQAEVTIHVPLWVWLLVGVLIGVLISKN